MSGEDAMLTDAGPEGSAPADRALTQVERLGLRAVDAFAAYAAAADDIELGQAADAALAELDAALAAAAHAGGSEDGEDGALDPVSLVDDGISR